MERTCPSNLEGVYVYIALVFRVDEGIFALCPDVRLNGVVAPTIEDLKQALKVMTLKHSTVDALCCQQAVSPLLLRQAIACAPCGSLN